MCSGRTGEAVTVMWRACVTWLRASQAEGHGAAGRNGSGSKEPIRHCGIWWEIFRRDARHFQIDPLITVGGRIAHTLFDRVAIGRSNPEAADRRRGGRSQPRNVRGEKPRDEPGERQGEAAVSVTHSGSVSVPGGCLRPPSIRFVWGRCCGLAKAAAVPIETLPPPVENSLIRFGSPDQTG